MGVVHKFLQSDKESLFLCGFETAFCDALKKPSGVARGGLMQITTYVIQNLSAQLSVLTCQI